MDGKTVKGDVDARCRFSPDGFAGVIRVRIAPEGEISVATFVSEAKIAGSGNVAKNALHFYPVRLSGSRAGAGDKADGGN